MFKLLNDCDMKKKVLAEKADVNIVTITKMYKDGTVVSSDDMYRSLMQYG